MASFALFGLSSRSSKPTTISATDGWSAAPYYANGLVFLVYVPMLALTSRSPSAPGALALAVGGVLLAAAGAFVGHWARIALGTAWSHLPKATEEVGLVTAGPYRLVRHPIYLGIALVALGTAVTFGSGPATLTAIVAVIPALVWRAHAEEKLLQAVFGTRYLDYRSHTKMMIPYVL